MNNKISINNKSCKNGLNKIVGDYGEMFVCHQLLMNNYGAYKNSSEDQTDIIAIGNSKVVKIQVKTARKLIDINGKEYFSFHISQKNHRYENVDYFAFIGINNSLSVSHAWIIPRKKVINHKATTISIASNSQKYKSYHFNWNI